MIEALPAGSATSLSVWLPARGNENEAAFRRQADAWVGPQVAHVWDGDRRIANTFATALAVTPPAWDVFLAYPRGIRWDGDAPPTPAAWMHQLPGRTGAPPDLAFEPGRFAELVAGLVAAPTPKPTAPTRPAPSSLPGRK